MMSQETGFLIRKFRERRHPVIVNGVKGEQVAAVFPSGPLRNAVVGWSDVLLIKTLQTSMPPNSDSTQLTHPKPQRHSLSKPH